MIILQCEHAQEKRAQLLRLEDGRWMVACFRMCGTGCCTKMYRTYDEAVEAWNEEMEDE